MTLRVLAALIAFAVLPASAQASTVELQGDGTLRFTGGARENNDVHVYGDGASGVRLYDYLETVRLVGSGCKNDEEVIVCPSGVTRVELELRDGDDAYTAWHGLPAFVNGGAGDDEYVHDAQIGGVSSRTDFRGGPGEDAADYAEAASGVTASKDDLANDGRAGDADNIHSDVEKLIGSPHADTLTGNANHGTRFAGGDGDDVMTAVGGRSVFEAGGDDDGADVIRGGKGLDELDYTERSEPVEVTVDGGTHDDGELGEGDDVAAVEWIDGGSADDTIEQAGSGSSEAYGGAGHDTLIGGAKDDYLDGEIGEDTVIGGPGPDTIHAADATHDEVDCGDDEGDWVWRDKHERSVRGCVTAGTLDLHATRSSMRITWTHAGGWRNRRRLTISPVQHGWNLGQIRIDPKRKRLTAVDLRLRPGGTVTRAGTRVTARFRYSLGAGFSGGHLNYRADALETE
jgi:Ca2+-binding RTX toxin-like protein